MTAAAPVPIRADAERNRLRVIEAAGSLFAERGLDVSMEDIARRAGVGVGTVYRRFGDREALMDAVFEQKIHAVADLARECLLIEDPWESFETFVRRSAAMQAADRGLKETVLMTAGGTQRLTHARETIRPVAIQIVQRAQAAGVLRPDVGELDLPMMQFAIAYVADRMRDAAPQYHGRIVTLLLDGLRTERTGLSPMPAPPLTVEQFEAGAAR